MRKDYNVVTRYTLTSDIKINIFELRRQKMKKKNWEDLLSVPFYLNLHNVAGFLRKGGCGRFPKKRWVK